MDLQLLCPREEAIRLFNENMDMVPPEHHTEALPNAEKIGDYMVNSHPNITCPRTVIVQPPTNLSQSFLTGFNNGLRSSEGAQGGPHVQVQRQHMGVNPESSEHEQLEQDDSPQLQMQMRGNISQLDSDYRRMAESAKSRDAEKKKEIKERDESIQKITGKDGFHCSALQKQQQRYAMVQEKTFSITPESYKREKQRTGFASLLRRQSGGVKSLKQNMATSSRTTSRRNSFLHSEASASRSMNLIQEEMESSTNAESASSSDGQIQAMMVKQGRSEDSTAQGSTTHREKAVVNQGSRRDGTALAVNKIPESPHDIYLRLHLKNRQFDCAILAVLQALFSMKKLVNVLRYNTSEDCEVRQLFQNAQLHSEEQDVEKLRSYLKNTQFGDLSKGRLAIYKAFIAVIDYLPEEARKMLTHQETAVVCCKPKNKSLLTENCYTGQEAKTFDSYFVDMNASRNNDFEKINTKKTELHLQAILEGKKVDQEALKELQKKEGKTTVRDRLDVTEVEHVMSYKKCEGCEGKIEYTGQVQYQFTKDNPYLILYSWENCVKRLTGINQEGYTELFGEKLKLLSAIRYESRPGGHFVAYTFHKDGVVFKHDDNTMTKEDNFDLEAISKDIRFYIFEREDSRSIGLNDADKIRLSIKKENFSLEDSYENATFTREPCARPALMKSVARNEKKDNDNIMKQIKTEVLDEHLEQLANERRAEYEAAENARQQQEQQDGIHAELVKFRKATARKVGLKASPDDPQPEKDEEKGKFVMKVLTSHSVIPQRKKEEPNTEEPLAAPSVVVKMPLRQRRPDSPINRPPQQFPVTGTRKLLSRTASKQEDRPVSQQSKAPQRQNNPPQPSTSACRPHTRSQGPAPAIQSLEANGPTTPKSGRKTPTMSNEDQEQQRRPRSRGPPTVPQTSHGADVSRNRRSAPGSSKSCETSQNVQATQSVGLRQTRSTRNGGEKRSSRDLSSVSDSVRQPPPKLHPTSSKQKNGTDQPQTSPVLKRSQRLAETSGKPTNRRYSPETGRSSRPADAPAQTTTRSAAPVASNQNGLPPVAPTPTRPPAPAYWWRSGTFRLHPNFPHQVQPELPEVTSAGGSQPGIQPPQPAAPVIPRPPVIPQAASAAGQAARQDNPLKKRAPTPFRSSIFEFSSIDQLD